jgi:proline dehydrogenase
MRKLLEPLYRPVLNFATRSYVAGDTLDDALQICASAASRGYGVSVCYWHETGESAERVAEEYLTSIDRLAAAKLDAHLAVKVPALHERLDLLGRVVERARDCGVGVDFDAHEPDKADDVFRVSEALGRRSLGLAMPGRWRRSLADADRAAELGLRVRVVKGEFPDPAEPDVDLREGYLKVIDRLAGRARLVGVATHDAWLSGEAIRRLKAAGTPCEQELLFGLPFEPAAAEARKAEIATRVYVPYGFAWLPYSVSRAVKNPRVFAWLARDFLAGRAREIPAPPKE